LKAIEVFNPVLCIKELACSVATEFYLGCRKSTGKNVFSVF